MSVVLATRGPQAPNRLNICDFVKNIYQFSLFVQALSNLSISYYTLVFHTHPSSLLGDAARMMEMDPDDPMSYYQLAAIHGRPYIRWPGEGKGADEVKQGYCCHGSVIFPTWHRPYLSLFEVRPTGHPC